MKGYIGSVRFFKNLILLLVLIFIAIPTVFAIRGKAEIAELEQTLTDSLQQKEQQITELQRQTDQLTKALNAVHFDPEGPGYQALYPDFHAPQPLDATTKESGVIYLTFDDGPSARTPEVLEILRDEDVKATFFVIGGDSEQRRQWMRDIVSDGHTLAMHTYSHDYNDIYESVEAYLADMYKIFTLIKEATGVTPTHFRLPGGSVNSYNYGVSQEILSEMLRRGFIPYDWNVSSGDASSGGASADYILSNVVNGASRIDRGIVLMHDASAKYTTVAALRSIIQQLRSVGFTFDALQPDTAPVLFGYAY